MKYALLILTFGAVSLVNGQDPKSTDESLETAKVALRMLNQNWKMSESKSLIDDSKTLHFQGFLTDENGKLTEPLMNLSIRHQEGELEVYIATLEATFSLARPNEVTTRFDALKASSEKWQPGTTAQALFSPNPKTFLRRAMQSKRLILRCTPLAHSPVTAVIELGPLHELLTPHTKQLGIELGGDKKGKGTKK